MGVEILFSCCCGATAKGTAPLTRKGESFSGREYGFGRPIAVNTIEDVTPDGWWGYDPWTYCTYCPECRKAIETPTPEPEEED